MSRLVFLFVENSDIFLVAVEMKPTDRLAVVVV